MRVSAHNRGCVQLAVCNYKSSYIHSCLLHVSYIDSAVKCAESMEELTGKLGETGNQTASMGYRSTEPARICGEGKSFLQHCLAQLLRIKPVSCRLCDSQHA